MPFLDKYRLRLELHRCAINWISFVLSRTEKHVSLACCGCAESPFAEYCQLHLSDSLSFFSSDHCFLDFSFLFYGAPLPPCSSCPRARKSRKVLSSGSFCVNAACFVSFWSISLAESSARSAHMRKEVKGYILASNEFTLVSAILDIVLLTISAIKAACVLLMKTM